MTILPSFLPSISNIHSENKHEIIDEQHVMKQKFVFAMDKRNLTMPYLQMEFLTNIKIDFVRCFWHFSIHKHES
jgi:hypothetical protein